MSANKPLPCPFCGARPKFHFVPESEAKPELPEAYWSLGCPGKPIACTATPLSFGATREEATANWNTRKAKGAHLYQVIRFHRFGDPVVEDCFDTEAQARAFIARQPWDAEITDRLHIERITSLTIGVIRPRKGGAA